MLLGYLADTHIRGEDHRHGSEAIAEALAGMKREGVSRVLCAGDVFDAPSILDKHAMTGTLVRAFLGPVEEYGIPWTLVEGNHDQAPASEKGALAAIAASPLCTVVSGDLSLTQLAKNVKVAFLPWLDKSYALLGPQKSVKTTRRYSAITVWSVFSASRSSSRTIVTPEYYWGILRLSGL